jgi:hypothetical protein
MLSDLPNLSQDGFQSEEEAGRGLKVKRDPEGKHDDHEEGLRAAKVSRHDGGKEEKEVGGKEGQGSKGGMQSGSGSGGGKEGITGDGSFVSGGGSVGAEGKVSSGGNLVVAAGGVVGTGGGKGSGEWVLAQPACLSGSASPGQASGPLYGGGSHKEGGKSALARPACLSGCVGVRQGLAVEANCGKEALVVAAGGKVKGRGKKLAAPGRGTHGKAGGGGGLVLGGLAAGAARGKDVGCLSIRICICRSVEILFHFV